MDSIGVDAVLVSDLGALALVREHAPHAQIHVSTQASVA
ncbi:MAG: U32 family peptidase, partial [Atopobiaceae bacterium]|nr:U32 family peptidase [Atopobiaceae bacterium]